MRNLDQYPITNAEKISTIRRLIEQETEALRIGGMGDITVAALQEILKDLYTKSAYDEGINDG